MQNCYCLDTSFLINGWGQYRIDVFPSIWSAIEANLSERMICSCDEVYRETQVQRNGLASWTKKHRKHFHKPTEDTLDNLRLVMEAFPNYAAQGGSANAADPLVIAHAITVGATVVTDEKLGNTKPTKPPKMPNACNALNVRCIKPIDFLHELGIRL
jgi:hypothetical protein